MKMTTRPDPVREDVNAKYDKIRCRVCGCPWPEHTSDPESTCDRYRPAEVPDWVLLAREKVDDMAKARGELVGTMTGEWPRVAPQRNGHA